MIVVGTRKSDLALTQSKSVAAALQTLGITTRLQRIVTQGDVVTHVPFSKMLGKGFFTKEIEQALLSKQVDLAVHSLKDLPTESCAGLEVVAIPAREDARDCLVMLPHVHDPQAAVLPILPGARVGTSAVRRQAQLQHWRADLQVVEVRGNVPTRLQLLHRGDVDAVLLAQAGLARLALDLSAYVTYLVPISVFVPAPGQGALALQIRDGDLRVKDMVVPLQDVSTQACTQAERALLARLGGGCHVPVGAYTEYISHGYQMTAFWGQAPRNRYVCVQASTVPQLVDKAHQQLCQN